MQIRYILITRSKQLQKKGEEKDMENNYILPFLWMRGEEEAVLREEMEKIYECGIRAVCLEARPHDDFCGPGWWHDMDIILDEAKKKDMKLWILDDKHFPTGYANGLIEKKYPERKKLYLACTTADIFGGAYERSLNVSRMLKPSIGFWQIGDPVDYAERENNQLYAILAVRYVEGNIFHEEVIDLTENYDGCYVKFTLPKGNWRVFVLYKTRTDGGNDTYINMIDKESAATQIEGVYESHFAKYGSEFGKTIAGFFSDEPQFGNVVVFNNYDVQVGRVKMQLPWSDELQENLTGLYGEGLAKALPFLFVESEEQGLRTGIRYDYMDQVSKLYKKNFSDAIGIWCEDHGVEYIGHVVEDNGIHSRLGMGPSHYFRAMSGQHMAGIDSIGGQILYGAPVEQRNAMTDCDGEFFHYTLGKLGASCGHLEPKKQGRTMCELFGAYGWSFGVRDMKYLLDHLLVKGVNHLVPHAFSMAEYPDPDCPPHFYARGNNPEFPYFARMMKYANRMCGLLNGGQHVASVAVLYDGEADWTGKNMPMQKVIRQLLEHQIDLDIVSLDMLDDLAAYNGRLDGKNLYINGVEFQALIIGYAKEIPERLAAFAEQAGEFPVIFVDGKPETVIGTGGCIERIEETAGEGRRAGVVGGEVIALSELAGELKARGFSDIAVDTEFKDLSFYHYKKDRQIFVFQNESAADVFCGKVTLPTSEPVVYYDAMEEVYELADFHEVEGKLEVSLELHPGECVVILEQKNIVCDAKHKSFREQLDGLESRDISADWTVSLVKAKEYPQFPEGKMVHELNPVSDEKPTFSGIACYEKTVYLDAVPERAVLKAEQVFEMMKVTVNGSEAGVRIFPPYQVEISGALKAGENKIVVEVAGTPMREMLEIPQPPFDFTHEALEPMGMFGKIELYCG